MGEFQQPRNKNDPPFRQTMINTVAYPEVNLVQGTGKSPVGGQGAKPPENFDDLLVKITFLKLNMPFYET